MREPMNDQARFLPGSNPDLHQDRKMSLLSRLGMLSGPGIVEEICVSSGGIPKRVVPWARVTLQGLNGDGHNHEKHNRLTQAVCLQDAELLRDLREEGFALVSGTIGENLTVRNLRVQKMPVGTILEFSGGVALELTKERQPCFVLDAIHPQLKEAIKGRCGFYAKVVREGILYRGETIVAQKLAPAAVQYPQFLTGSV